MKNPMRLRRLAIEAAPEVDWHWKSTALGVHVEGQWAGDTYKLSIADDGGLRFVGRNVQATSHGPWDDAAIRRFISTWAHS